MDKEPDSKARKIRDELIWLLGMFLIIFGARSSLADHYVVPTGSMEYTLMPGDRVVVDKRAYGLRLPFTSLVVSSGDAVRRGEVVIFDSPSDGTRLIKRVVAVGGDTVLLKSGRLWVNGTAMQVREEPFTEQLGERRFRLNLTHGGGPDLKTTVPDGHLLTIGDHRGNSRDGRVFGFVPDDAIYGRAIAVYYRRGAGLEWLSL